MTALLSKCYRCLCSDGSASAARNVELGDASNGLMGTHHRRKHMIVEGLDPLASRHMLSLCRLAELARDDLAV